MTMRQIVKDIIETESKIRETLDQARREAAEIRLAAEKDASEQVSGASGQAREIIQAAAQEAKKKSQQIREETLRQADQQADASADGKKGALEDLVTRICAVVLNTESEMDDQ